MKGQLSVFQVVLLAIFGAFALGGVIFFALGRYGSSSQSIGNVAIWGTLNQHMVDAALRTLSDNDSRLLSISYKEYDPRTFDQSLSDAIASGTGPDLVLIDDEYLLKDAPKLMPFPYSGTLAVPQQTYRDTFADGTNIFLTGNGAMGIPLAIDPLVMYVNRDLVATAGFASSSPATWNEVFDVAQKATKQDDSKNIIKSGVALGEYSNITHAKDILATLMMQAGSPITQRDSTGKIHPALEITTTAVNQPSENALRYYTEFSDPSKIVYSWNRSLPQSLVAFGQGDVALYVGYASEYALLHAENPNLNFTVAKIPQIQQTSRAITFGRIYAFAVPRGSRNPIGAAQAALILTNANSSNVFWQATGIPSARRDVLGGAADGVQAVMRDSAIIARGWLDPDPEQTEAAFKGMIEDAMAGATHLQDAVQRADRTINSLLPL